MTDPDKIPTVPVPRPPPLSRERRFANSLRHVMHMLENENASITKAFHAIVEALPGGRHVILDQAHFRFYPDGRCEVGIRAGIRSKSWVAPSIDAVMKGLAVVLAWEGPVEALGAWTEGPDIRST